MSETTNTGTGDATTTVSAEYLAAARQRIRTSSTASDGELTDLINAARDDLVLGGVLPVWTADESDALIKKAIMTYVKAEYGLDNEDSEKYRASYHDQKVALALSTKYTEEPTAAEEGA